MITVDMILEFRETIPDKGYIDPSTGLLTTVFSDDELTRILERAIQRHTEGLRDSGSLVEDDWALSLILAHHSAILTIAAVSAKFFKWTEGDVSVDKTKETQNLLRIARELRLSYNDMIETKGDILPPVQRLWQR